MFSKFGKISRLDYLFHKTGALRGKPRGYAFVEYASDAVSYNSLILSRREEREKTKISCAHPGSIPLLPYLAIYNNAPGLRANPVLLPPFPPLRRPGGDPPRRELT